MIRVYGFKGFPLFFVAGLILALVVFVWGFAKAIGLLLPFLIVAAYLIIVTFSFGFLPALMIRTLRPTLCVHALWMSRTLDAVIWLVSFFFVVKAFGGWGIMLAFLFQLLSPVAIVGAALKGAWAVAANLIVWIGFSYGMKIYSRRLADLEVPPAGSGRSRENIIDVEAREVKDQPWLK